MPPQHEEVTGILGATQMTPDDFAREIPRKWNALEAVVNAITEQVKAGELSPVEGYKLVGCATAEVFDYQTSHGSILSASPLEIFNGLRALMPEYFRGGNR